MSSFTGKLAEFPHISVDRFDGRNLASTAYFLSHAHSDHMVGLSSPQFLDHLESNQGVYLYCSIITARFLHASIRHRPLAPFLRPLPLDEPVRIAIPAMANEPHHSLTITLIPARHCPGSVMLLLEGKSGTVLYTGDFRLPVGECNRIQALHNPDGTVKTIHSLHIDTTFCNRRVLSFPSPHDSSEAIGDLVEEWLARGNNHLIHLQCPAKYGYEFVYRSLHERFNMRIHVDRWKFGMYDTMPEIQENLTTDPTETWIHDCSSRKGVETNDLMAANSAGKRQLPCRCVPYGIDSEPNIRVIRPSALFFTSYPTHKEVCQVSEDASFCRVLLSMHASCSELLDMVAYLRPRKVYPNVIPTCSSKEEVLSLLHEALSQSGDHYSIEYEGRGTGCGDDGLSYDRSCRRMVPPLPLSAASNDLGEGVLGSFKRQLPPPSHTSKKRRYSDSSSIMQDVLLLALPNPRGNIKGSLSLEGEHQQVSGDAVDYDTDSKVNTYHSSTSPAQSSPMSAPVSPMLASKMSDLLHGSSDGVVDKWLNRCNAARQDSDCSSVFSDDTNSTVMCKNPECADISEAGRVPLVRDLSITSVLSEGGETVKSLVDDKAGRRRRMWYKHHHFSTPVTEDCPNYYSGHENVRLTVRSSSLPDPHSMPLSQSDCRITEPHVSALLSSRSLYADNLIPSSSPPMITVSSPCSTDCQNSSDSANTHVFKLDCEKGLVSDSHTNDVDCNAEWSSRSNSEDSDDGKVTSTVDDDCFQSTNKNFTEDGCGGTDKAIDYSNSKNSLPLKSVGDDATDEFSTSNDTLPNGSCLHVNGDTVNIYRPSVIRTALSVSGASSDRGPQEDCNDFKNRAASADAVALYASQKYFHVREGSLPELAASNSLESTSHKLVRSSCLKTARRTATDLLEVVSLDHQ